MQRPVISLHARSRKPVCEGCAQALKKAKEVANMRPDAIVTDGLQAYRRQLRTNSRRRQIQNPHIRLKDFETKPNNNIIERLQGTFRERTKVVRSLDSGIGAEDFALGMQTYYNYIDHIRESMDLHLQRWQISRWIYLVTGGKR